MTITRLILVDDYAQRCYVKTKDGAVGYVKNPVGKFRQRKRLERHMEAELNRTLLKWAIAQKVKAPDKSPASFNKLYNTGRQFFAPLNIIVSRGNPKDLVMFWRKQAIATISPKSLERFIANLVRLKSQHKLWLKTQGNTSAEETEDDPEQDESWEDGEEEL